MQNSLIIDAIKGKPTPRTPIWIMRQAGRYLPQYRELREKVTLLEAFHSPEIAAELTLQPVELLDVDAAIIYSDILLIPEALGMSLDYIPAGGSPVPGTSTATAWPISSSGHLPPPRVARALQARATWSSARPTRRR